MYSGHWRFIGILPARFDLYSLTFLWAAIESIAPKIGCVPQTLNEWVNRDQVDSCVCDGITTSERKQMKALERENRELRKANEILRLASAFFAQAELDRRLKS